MIMALHLKAIVLKSPNLVQSLDDNCSLNVPVKQKFFLYTFM